LELFDVLVTLLDFIIWDECDSRTKWERTSKRFASNEVREWYSPEGQKLEEVLFMS